MAFSGNLVVNKAREYLGVRYYHCGHIRSGGLDCLGLVLCVFSDLGVVFPKIKKYGRAINSRNLLSQVDEHFTEVHGDPVPGDVLIMLFDDTPSHFAIYTGETIIHSYERVGEVVEHRFSNSWKSKVFKVVRYV